MEALLKRQKVLKEEIDRFVTNFKKAIKTLRGSIGYLERRLEGLNKYWTDFEQTNIAIMQAVTDDDLESSYFIDETFDTAEGIYYEISGTIQDLLDQLTGKNDHRNQSSSSISINQGTSSPTGDLRLPRITINKFAGDYKSWTSFHDLFDSLVNKNSSLSSVQKLHYLKTNLIGEAEQLIRHFQITSANYEPAWEMLVKRYQNVRALVNAQLHLLLNQPHHQAETPSAIKALLDTSRECLEALKGLGVDINCWDPIIIYLMTQNLSTETHTHWELALSNRSDSAALPKISEFMSFLESRFRILEALDSSKAKSTIKLHRPGQTINKTRSFMIEKKLSCPICSNEHIMRNCPTFRSMNLSDRRETVKRHSHCFNCILPGHSVKQCRGKTNCYICGRRHHSLLHLDNTQEAATSSSQPEDPKHTTRVNSAMIEAQSMTRNVLLATALIDVEGKNQERILLRALLDQGSEATLITEEAAQRLKLKGAPSNVQVCGIGQVGDGTTAKTLKVTLHSKYNCDVTLQVEAYVMKKLTGILPTTTLRHNNWTHIDGLKLADPAYYKPGRIDMILGAEVYSQVLLDGIRKGERGTPTAQHTTLGWILSGGVRQSSLQIQNRVHTLYCTMEIDRILKQFWEIEEMPARNCLSREEELCEHFFERTHRRLPDGRYVVRLPFNTKDFRPNIGESRYTAIKQLLQIERKLMKNASICQQYKEFMKDYSEQGHMELVKPNESWASVRSINYLPHHSILKESSTTTKLRVVFDASRKTSNGKSLNDNLLVGPTIQNDLFTILLNWRKHKFVFTADIKQMYRQILVHEDDQDCQRIIWREDPQQPIRDYKLKTVTYGTACAPHLAIRTIRQLAVDEKDRYPLGSKVVLNDMYVDDVISGFDSKDEAFRAQFEIKQLLVKGGFQLRKWTSNSAAILEGIPEIEREIKPSLEFSENQVIKTLGIHWCPKTDLFEYKINLAEEKVVNKRTILSQIARVFDPLGLISPVIISAKILMQKLWLAGVSWDDPIPREITQEWLTYKISLKGLENIPIPRWIGLQKSKQDIDIHGFCDASMQAYGACIYIRIKEQTGNCQTRLLVSKTRVAPIKQVTLPRLELCGAVLLARLFKLIEPMVAEINSIPVAWTDSKIVIAWLRGHPSRWKPFVANRVTEILTSMNSNQWRYVPTNDNPADLASRGCSPNKLKNSSLWWVGPHWLQLSSNQWPTEIEVCEESQLEVKKTNAFTSTKTSLEFELLTRYSSLSKLIRITAYCLRFFKNSKCPVSARDNSILSVQERIKALQRWIILSQGQCFHLELSQLRKNKGLSSSSAIRCLNPFLDSDGILRVGGRLKNSNLKFSEKHPILLPNKNKLTTLIIEEMHRITLHGGLLLTANIIRKKYWIVHAGSEIKKVLHRCITCFRQTAASRQQLMGNLPTCRVTSERPFTHTGVDFSGPIELKMGKRRGRQTTTKGYIAIFICMASKAVHLEAVSDLSTSSFLAALQRFTGRRGNPSIIYSDNGTNFVGASSELKRTFREFKAEINEELFKLLADKCIEWKFIPPASPHFGGLWEAGVKSMKYHLKRIISTVLTFEEMSTALVQVEACLNSRPLCPLSSDPNDCTALTPGHFLIGDALVAIPEPSLIDVNINRLNRWQLIQRIKQDFWKRWNNEYLSRLQQRPKWMTKETDAKVGNLVIIKDERLPPSKWLLARVIKVHPGNDGLTRVVTLKCKDNILKRPITKICLLPISDNE